MDPYSSGEDLVIKTRKPYTITKQRERWTEEEHNRFLEALKLYGRAWQRIEEHIGTKTAVQIRSHAQKFFTKLEKEANGKGVPIGHALDIDIPPPRPKRKPSNPYPRKKGAEAPNPQTGVKNGNKSCSVSSSCHSKLTVAMEKEPGEEPNDDEKSDYSNNENRTVPCPSLSPADSLRKPCTFTQYAPLLKEASNHDGTAASQITVEASGMKSGDRKTLFNVSNVADSNPTSHLKSLHCEKTDEHIGKSSTDEVQASTNNYPHPIYTVDGSLAVNHHQSNNTSRSSNEPLYSYHPPIFTPIQNQEDYDHSFLNVSTVFSSLIISALSQNPASYAAARYAVTLWPCMNNMEAPVVGLGGGSPCTVSASSTLPLNHSPSLAAIAAATVASATAWWAANGLLPPSLCTPFQPLMNNSQGSQENGPDNLPPVLLSQQQLEPECSEDLLTMHEQQKQQSIPKSPAVSSSESKVSADAKPSVVEAPAKNVDTEGKNTPKNKKPEKPANRSSCGSNSDVEADAKGEEDDEKVTNEKEISEDPLSRRCRSTVSYLNDSWKEVSEEGRLAFQALFSREVLPQSFSPLHNDVKNKGKKMWLMFGKENAKRKDENGLQLDLNVTWPHKQEGDGNVPLINGNKDEEILNMGLGLVKLKARQTGFKPYKRCSLEAKDSLASTNNQDEEKGPKRLRIEGEAST